jgi:cellulose synthase/poly-beta-1,6-N-acetylglucosamine synthase-like glycosyltransferase
MPTLTALVHTQDDAPRLGRALETLLPCDEILVVDHGSQDATRRIAREYGARVAAAVTGAVPSQWSRIARCEWILCVEPSESLTEALVASLLEWKSRSHGLSGGSAFSLYLREETSDGWREHPTPQTRIVPREWSRWQGRLPAPEPGAIALEGALLRFILP